jgi:CBS domain-containing protein
MLAKFLVTDSVVPLKTSDSASYAIKMMEDYKVTHIPIVNNVEFLGLISEEDILTHNKLDDPIGVHNLSTVSQFVYDHQHIFEVITIFASQKLTLLPVLNKQNQYLGVIMLTDLIQRFSEVSSMQNPGGIIILEINVNDYSLVEIASIVESNNSKIINMFVSPHNDSTKIELTLKINKMDIYPILQTFERYSYNVLASYSESEINDNLKERYDLLMNYLNI